MGNKTNNHFPSLSKNHFSNDLVNNTNSKIKDQRNSITIPNYTYKMNDENKDNLNFSFSNNIDQFKEFPIIDINSNKVMPNVYRE